MSGQKEAGCCVHVATVIYYLSYARNHNYKIPAEYLNNIFVNTSKKEPANNPQYVHNKRQNNVISSSESESEDETYSLNSDLTLSEILKQNRSTYNTFVCIVQNIYSPWTIMVFFEAIKDDTNDQNQQNNNKDQCSNWQAIWNNGWHIQWIFFLKIDIN